MGALSTPGVRIVFAGTSDFAVPILEAIVESGYEVPGVVTQPDRRAGRGQTLQAPPVKSKALALRLPVYQPATLKDDDARTLFETLSPDVMVVVAYGKLIPAWLLNLPRFGAVNLHGSLLPRYRGAAPIQWAIANGERETGVCTMQLDEGLDTGPVYACERASIGPDETSPELSARLSALGCDLMKRTLAGLLSGKLVPVPQDHALATYAPILRKEDSEINWNRPALEIHNRIRAFTPWPGSRTQFRDSTCKVLRSRVLAFSTAAAPGTVLPVNTVPENCLAVACGGGTALELVEVQVPNRKPQGGIDFVNGLRVTSGEKFGNPSKLTDN